MPILTRNWPSLLTVATLMSIPLVAQTPPLSFMVPRPAIVSTAHPTDSRGETVYESQPYGQENKSVVPGKFVPPKLIDSTEPRFSAKLTKQKFRGTVTLQIVVAQNGDVIDIETLQSKNKEAT